MTLTERKLHGLTGKPVGKNSSTAKNSCGTEELIKALTALRRQLKSLEKRDTAQAEVLRLLLLDRLLHLGKSCIDKGEISCDDRRRFHAMHACYRNTPGGNGEAEAIAMGVGALPLK